MPVKLQTTDEVITAYLMGEIDHHSAKFMREEIDGALERLHPGLLVLDFGDVSFMDSSGIGLVMGRYKLARELGCTLRVQNLPLYLKKVMRLAGLDRLGILDEEGKHHEKNQ